ncbi:MAG: serine hydrolase domain-containing protein, partial [Myxococcaceae bacterium]
MIAVRIALMAVLGSITGSSALARDDDIDRYLTREMKRLHLPGLSLAIVRDGRVIKARGYGLANLELKAPATTSTVYEIGSNTKQFTAAAILLLVEQGKLGLDDSVRKFFPEAPGSWQRITVRHLLSHTSGIQNHVAVPGYLDVFR